MKNQDFKKLLIRQSFDFSVEIIKLVDAFNRKDFSLQVIAHQIIKSATSIGANIVEAQAATSNKDFINFLSYALKSANETIYWLQLLYKSDKASKEEVGKLLTTVITLSKLLGSSIKSLKSKISQ